LKAILGVLATASYLGVSHQRVRLLLASGRIVGFKNPQSGYWQVPFPPTIRHGARGPRLGFKAALKPQKVVEISGRNASPKLGKEVRKNLPAVVRLVGRMKSDD
jgi:hypothetical protein